jgi:hypothetical protein
VVRAAAQRQSRTFRCTFEVSANIEQQFPPGRIEISAFVAEGFENTRVDAVYVSIPEHAGEVHETRAFDDGSVVLDLDATGCPIGVELTTTRRGWTELPEFNRYARESASRLPAVMAVTALGLARRYELALVDAMATVRAVARQLADQGVRVQLDEVRVREALVEQVREEPTFRGWRPELVSA